MTKCELTVERTFDSPCEQVFDAVLAAPTVSAATSQPGDILEVITLAGTPGRPGYQTSVRFNWDMIDIRYTETLLEYDRPFRIRLERFPDQAFPYDPSERLPHVGDEVFPDPNRVFRKAYGDDPKPQFFDFTIRSLGGRSLLVFHLAEETHRPLGAWASWRWRRRTERDMNGLITTIGARIRQTHQVQ